MLRGVAQRAAQIALGLGFVGIVRDRRAECTHERILRRDTAAVGTPFGAIIGEVHDAPASRREGFQPVDLGRGVRSLRRHQEDHLHIRAKVGQRSARPAVVAGGRQVHAVDAVAFLRDPARLVRGVEELVDRCLAHEQVLELLVALHLDHGDLVLVVLLQACDLLVLDGLGAIVLVHWRRSVVVAQARRNRERSRRTPVVVREQAPAVRAQVLRIVQPRAAGEQLELARLDAVRSLELDPALPQEDQLHRLASHRRGGDQHAVLEMERGGLAVHPDVGHPTAWADEGGAQLEGRRQPLHQQIHRRRLEDEGFAEDSSAKAQSAPMANFPLLRRWRAASLMRTQAWRRFSVFGRSSTHGLKLPVNEPTG